MKTKALFIYIALGIAFAAVSLWVFLSKGKNARAIRTKYKLGGAMIAAWAILSAANCQGPGPMVTCYDPVPPQNEVLVAAKDQNAQTLKCGDIIQVMVLSPTFREYQITLATDGAEPKLLQSETFVREEGEVGSWEATFEIEIAETDYKGAVVLKVYGIDADAEKTLVGKETIILH
jgi:hypothetical protein